MARDLALHLRRKHHVTGIPTTEEIETMIEAEGLDLDPDQPFAGELLGACINGNIAVRAGLSPPERRRVLLHEFAHWLVDTGNQHYLLSTDLIQVRQQERRAELTAGWLLFGESALRADLLTISDLAELGEVPVEFASWWWEMAQWEIRSSLAAEQMPRRRGRRRVLAEANAVGRPSHFPPSARIRDAKPTRRR